MTIDINHKRKIDKLYFTKISKSFSKDTVKKKASHKLQKIFTRHIANKRLSFRIFKNIVSQ